MVKEKFNWKLLVVLGVFAFLVYVILTEPEIQPFEFKDRTTSQYRWNYLVSEGYGSCILKGDYYSCSKQIDCEQTCINFRMVVDPQNFGTQSEYRCKCI